MLACTQTLNMNCLYIKNHSDLDLELIDFKVSRHHQLAMKYFIHSLKSIGLCVYKLEG